MKNSGARGGGRGLSILHVGTVVGSLLFQYGRLSGVPATLSNETQKQCLLKGHNRAFMGGHLPRENNQLCSQYLCFVVHWMLPPPPQVFGD
jgi:hypothetical protein